MENDSFVFITSHTQINMIIMLYFAPLNKIPRTGKNYFLNEILMPTMRRHKKVHYV